MPCIICGETRGVQGAHIKPRRHGGMERMPLCPTCHWNYDHDGLNKREVKFVEEYLKNTTSEHREKMLYDSREVKEIIEKMLIKKGKVSRTQLLIRFSRKVNTQQLDIIISELIGRKIVEEKYDFRKRYYSFVGIDEAVLQIIMKIKYIS